MTIRTAPAKVGVLVWNQYTGWPAMRDLGARADALGYDSLWTWDHLFPCLLYTSDAADEYNPV
mgnify:CR=1 FL=1